MAGVVRVHALEDQAAPVQRVVVGLGGRGDIAEHAGLVSAQDFDPENLVATGVVAPVGRRTTTTISLGFAVITPRIFRQVGAGGDVAHTPTGHGYTFGG